MLVTEQTVCFSLPGRRPSNVKLIKLRKSRFSPGFAALLCLAAASCAKSQALDDAGRTGQSGGGAGTGGEAGAGGPAGSGGAGLGGAGGGGGSIDAAAPDTANDVPTTPDSGTAGGDAGPGGLPIKGRTGMKSAGCGMPPMGAHGDHVHESQDLDPRLRSLHRAELSEELHRAALRSGWSQRADGRPTAKPSSTATSRSSFPRATTRTTPTPSSSAPTGADPSRPCTGPGYQRPRREQRHQGGPAAGDLAFALQLLRGRRDAGAPSTSRTWPIARTGPRSRTSWPS